jgi:hypothetical protein
VALLDALTVAVVVPFVVRDVELNVTVTSEGCPVALKATDELKPPDIVRVAVMVLLEPPWVTVKLVGDAAFTAAIEDADTVKSAPGVTTSVTGAAYSTRLSPVPLKLSV